MEERVDKVAGSILFSALVAHVNVQCAHPVGLHGQNCVLVFDVALGIIALLLALDSRAVKFLPLPSYYILVTCLPHPTKNGGQVQRRRQIQKQTSRHTHTHSRVHELV